MISIFAFAFTIFIGFTLGLFGGGGSILMVPLLVYFFNIHPILATSYSLFIIGVSSSIGSINYIRNGLVSFKTVAFFGVPSLISIAFTRHVILPIIPESILKYNDFELSKGVFLLIFFAIIMILASLSMIKGFKKREFNSQIQKEKKYILLIFQGLFVGFITGLVGAGGGFLIIPALVVFINLPMKKAVGTSLLIISFNSLVAFFGDCCFLKIDWNFLLVIVAFSILGIFFGMYFSSKIKSDKLKPLFGWFVLSIGIFILVKELFFKN